MKGMDAVRNVLGALIVAGTAISLIADPIPVQVILIFAAVGILAGTLLVVGGDLVPWIAAAVLVFGPDWVQSVLEHRGYVMSWYTPTLIATSFAIIAYFVGERIKPRPRTITF
jgi:hypothetical protein